jgi:hypothetical protein
VILETIVERGYPPHFTELARVLDVSPAIGRDVSAARGHLPAFVERLREVTRGIAFWDPAL